MQRACMIYDVWLVIIIIIIVLLYIGTYLGVYFRFNAFNVLILFYTLHDIYDTELHLF